MKSHLKQPINIAHWPFLSTFAALVLMTSMAASSAHASNNEKTLSHQVPVEQQRMLVLENGVGVIEFRHTSEPMIQVEVKLEGNRSGILRRRVDVSDMDISIDMSDEQLSLSFDENNVNANWVVYLPDFDYTRVKLGVGKIQGAYFSGDLDVSLGVGDVTLAIPSALLGSLQASVGVGAVSVNNGAEFDSERRVVSEKVSGRGRGDFKLTLDVGVGDITINSN